VPVSIAATDYSPPGPGNRWERYFRASFNRCYRLLAHHAHSIGGSDNFVPVSIAATDYSPTTPRQSVGAIISCQFQSLLPITRPPRAFNRWERYFRASFNRCYRLLAHRAQRFRPSWGIDLSACFFRVPKIRRHRYHMQCAVLAVSSNQLLTEFNQPEGKGVRNGFNHSESG
jgi:hypothetical protein